MLHYLGKVAKPVKLLISQLICHDDPWFIFDYYIDDMLLAQQTATCLSRTNGDWISWLKRLCLRAEI